MSWSASTDNVGVAGYGEYRGSSRVGTTGQTAATFTNLVCGTAYQVGVDAYDTAGNRSSRADMTATTSACPDIEAPSTPTNVVVGTRTATSIALSWSRSTDNVGTVGYGVYVAALAFPRPRGRPGSSTASPAARTTRSEWMRTTPPAIAPRRHRHGRHARVRRHAASDHADRPHGLLA